MPVGKREGAYNTTGERRRRRSNTSSSPYKHNTSREHQTNDEGRTEDSGDEDNNSNNSTEDHTDSTTKHHPTTTPTTTPNSLTTHTTPPTTSYHTSGHTDCRTRPRISPRKKTEEDCDFTAEETKTRKHQSSKRMFLILIVFLVIVGLFSFHQAMNRRKEEEELRREPKLISEVYADLKTELRRLNKEFSQPREVWLGLLSQFDAVMVERPSQPAVVLLVVSDDSKGAATCLAHSLARAVQRAFEDTQFVMYDSGGSRGRSDGVVKVELDEALKGLSTSHSAVIHNIEHIPGHAAMILHAYCDNDNAPFKQAVIFLLAELPGKYEELGYSRLDSLIDSHLTSLWGRGLAEKDVSALISRTSNTPILVRPEEPWKMMEICPL